jgi:hypothetical protein
MKLSLARMERASDRRARREQSVYLLRSRLAPPSPTDPGAAPTKTLHHTSKIRQATLYTSGHHRMCMWATQRFTGCKAPHHPTHYLPLHILQSQQQTKANNRRAR